MKALGKCPHCGKTVMTDCKGCIEAGTCCGHNCKNSNESVIEKVSWKKFPENEGELKELERNAC